MFDLIDRNEIKARLPNYSSLTDIPKSIIEGLPPLKLYGISADDILTLALILKESGATAETIHDCNECFFLGYQTAQQHFINTMKDIIKNGI